VKIEQQKIVFEVESDETLSITVEPEACEWTIKRGDKFEITWPATNEPPHVIWYGQSRISIWMPEQYELRLNGTNAFELL
jgi:hypothetical protein